MASIYSGIGKIESFCREFYGTYIINIFLQLKIIYKFDLHILYVIYTFSSFQNAIVHVEKNINEMLQTQHWSRSREERDLNLLLDNNSYVQMWSIAQVIVITLTTMIQVYFVRKLFDVKPSGYSKTRI